MLAVLGWWKGGWFVEKMEELAGVAPVKPVPNLLVSAPREQKAGGVETPRTKVAEAGLAPAADAGKAVAPVEMTKAPAPEEPFAKTKTPAPVPAKVPAADALISAEGKKQGEILLTDSLVKAVAEKPAGPEAPKVPLSETPAAALPAGGLQPMKVELAMEELVTQNPEEREKKRVEVVEDFLRMLKVQGVRLQGAESRILVDGVPIGLGERVGALGLVLESVEPQKIIFSDASGKKFPKNY